MEEGFRGSFSAALRRLSIAPRFFRRRRFRFSPLFFFFFFSNVFKPNELRFRAACRSGVAVHNMPIQLNPRRDCRYAFIYVHANDESGAR